MFGKALGNGYAITAVIGKSNIMQRRKKVLLAVPFGQKELDLLQEFQLLIFLEKKRFGKN